MTFGATHDDESNPNGRQRRKLRPLVISLGGARQEQIEQMFATLGDDFEAPAFSPGISSRSLRSRTEFLKLAHEVGLVPDAEMQAFEVAQEMPEYQERPDRLWECLKDVPVTLGRKGSDHDVNLHYSVEFWQKAKTLNRGRATLACLMAHLRAMRRLVEEGYDFILEDNVRAPPEVCAKRIWDTIDASEKWQQENNEHYCHLRYYGWLGSNPNLHWVINTHIPRTAISHEDDTEESFEATVFPFPIKDDFGVSPEDESVNNEEEHPDATTGTTHQPAFGHTKPGGTAIWGAYAYWISEQGLNSLMDELKMDVGSILWRGNRSRTYFVKPIDKVLPRKVMTCHGRSSIHVSTRPCFFRAPMLTSNIHAQWDAEFCKSTEYQMEHCGLSWADLWLSESERRIVHHYDATGKWMTMDQLAELESESGEQ